MKSVYPIILTKGKEFIIASIPDFGINTQGKDIAEAVEMARDAIGIVGLDIQDADESLPIASDIAALPHPKTAIVTPVDVDFEEYRKKLHNERYRPVAQQVETGN